jgi:hypothetical protein
MIQPISDKKLEVLKHDVGVKKKAIKRCGGIPYESSFYKGVCINVRCMGGICERCGLVACPPTYELHNHEKVFKSAGGEVTEDNTVMICDCCHAIVQQHMGDEQAERLIKQLRG